MRNFLGIDLGGTKIKAVLINELGEILTQTSTETDAHLGVNAVIDKMENIFKEVQQFDRTPILAVGVTVPAVVNSKKGTIELMPNFSTKWKGVKLGEILSERVGVPFFLINDARAATYGEKKFGGAQKFDNFVSIIIGTGVGGGVVLNGEMYFGSRGAAGELGHQVVRPNGVLCGCGNRGCLETVASGTAISSAAYRYVKQGIDTKMSELVQGDLNKISPEIVAIAASEGDEAALEILSSVAKYVVRSIQNLIAILNPEAVVLGGGVARSNVLVELIEKELVEKKCLLPDELGKVQVVQSTLDGNSGAIGAAGWAIDRYQKN